MARPSVLGEGEGERARTESATGVEQYNEGRAPLIGRDLTSTHGPRAQPWNCKGHVASASPTRQHGERPFTHHCADLGSAFGR